MIWSAPKPLPGTQRLTPQTSDGFSSATLSPQWEWHYQPRADKWSLTERPGVLRLHAFRGPDGDNLLKIGNVLTQRVLRTATNVVTVKLAVEGMGTGQSCRTLSLHDGRLCRGWRLPDQPHALFPLPFRTESRVGRGDSWTVCLVTIVLGP